MSSSSTCLQDGSFLISFIPSLLCLIIVIIIFIKSIKHFQTKPEIHSSLKLLFYTSCILSIPTIILVSIDILISCIPALLHLHKYTNTFFISYGGLTLSVGIMLLIRIYFAFKESVLQISKCQKYAFIMLPICGVISFYGAIITQRLRDSYTLTGIEQRIYGIFLLLTGLFYFGTNIYGILIFAKKMYKLSELISYQQETELELNPDCKDEQRELLQTTAKYISLLSLAIFTTWITFVSVVIYSNTGNWGVLGYQIYTMQWSVDCMINIICLYLQYPFSKDYYDAYCTCLSKCCLYFLVGNMEGTHRVKLKFVHSFSKSSDVTGEIVV